MEKKEKYMQYWKIRAKDITIECICRKCEEPNTEIDCPKCPVFLFTNDLKKWQEEQYEKMDDWEETIE